jgi:hypothetical protein
MPLDHKRKLALCHIPRTGGVSIVISLGLDVQDYHFPASYYRKNFPDYYLFAVQRDYKERIKSAYGWKMPDNYRFDDLTSLVNDRYVKGGRNIGLMIKPDEYFLDVPVDRLLRFDHLEEDLNHMLTDLGHLPVKLVQSNSFKIMDIQSAIDKANSLKSQLTDEVISKLDGYSNAKVWHLLNNLVAQAYSYLEVGCFKGSTLSAALYGNSIKAFAVDNFSYGNNSREYFYRNTEGLKFTFFEQDCWTVDLSQIEPVDVYFYDGDHSFESHYKALTYYLPVMKDEFVYVCDDWDMKRIPNATFTAAKDLNLEVLEKHELPGKHNKEFWNGIGVIKFRKT